MTLRPVTPEELATSLRAANLSRSPVGEVDLSALGRVLEHTPEDMTVTVEAGATLAALQRQLATRGQWLPIDPPHPERLTIAALLDHNLSGPRRHGCGTIRDHLIGLRVALADGRLIRSGGKVVKNVAGYDLMKLFIGARGSLGILVEATFKLLPLPEAETFVAVRCASLADVERFRAAVLDSELTPTVFDLHNMTAPEGGFDLVLGFSGVRQAVEHQVAVAARIGISEAASLDYEARFHDADQPAYVFSGGVRPSSGAAAQGVERRSIISDASRRADVAAPEDGRTPPQLQRFTPNTYQPAAQRLSVLPSRLVEALHSLGSPPFVARAGNGLVYHRVALTAPERSADFSPQQGGLAVGSGVPGRLPQALIERVKQTFDPNHIFPAAL